MLDLKPLYDAARAASDKMQTVLKDMETAFAEGTEEGKAKALELRLRWTRRRSRPKRPTNCTSR